ncbi:uncharacterized protein LOC120113259 [Phoenix dactylifera]|uniref:Uncharacterized protein LOC103697009 n=1 Tax=Phoenix dactylifera TaxID=42345 RepID=A0A8B7BHR3_PHODC|nr:uncharacterized protein LOC103697009 [Phoenix dactylifera]XP_038990088.1 uncharacterized protein LOC120113259 [Phoenix dactylifera]
MRDFDGRCPAGIRHYDDGRGLEVVTGKASISSRTNICRLPPPPGARRRAVGGGGVLTSSMTSSSSSGPAPWRAADAEAKRRRRVAGYKVYTVESKVKSSIRKGLRWVKGLVRGW